MGGLRPVGDLSPHRLQPFFVVEHQLPYPAVQVVEDGPVSGEYEVCAEAARVFQRLQVAGERVRFGLGPEPDVRGDPEQQVVRGEEYAARLVVKHYLVVRVPRNVDDANRSLPHRQLFTGADRNYLPRQRQGVTHHGGGRFGGRLRHPVPDQVPDEWSDIRGTPEFADEGDLTLHHVDWRPCPFLQPARRPDVVGVEVRHHDLVHVPPEVAAQSGCPTLPRRAGRRVVIARVHEGPAVVALDEVHGDEAQRERHRQLELPDVQRHSGGFADGLRGDPGGGDGQAIALK